MSILSTILFITHRNESRSNQPTYNNHQHQEKESSKDSAYGVSGGETSRLGNPQTREPTPEEKAGDARGAYRRPSSRYSNHARYRRYHKQRGAKDMRNRHTSSSRSDDERVPDKRPNRQNEAVRIQQQLQRR